MSIPILFLCSAEIAKLEELYHLKDLGKLLNLADNRTPAEVQAYPTCSFILCNLQDEEQKELLRFIPREYVTSVAVLRSHESTHSEWIDRLKPDYRIKTFNFEKCKTKDELLNYIKLSSSIKTPDSNVKYYAKKLSFLFSCFKSIL